MVFMLIVLDRFLHVFILLINLIKSNSYHYDICLLINIMKFNEYGLNIKDMI